MHQIIYYSPYQHQTCPTDYLRIINTPRTSGYGDYNVMNATRTDTPVMINYVFKDTCRHLDWTVFGSFSGLVVASMKTTCLGGSSKFLSNALKLSVVSI